MALKHYHGGYIEELQQQLENTRDQAKLELVELNFSSIYNKVKAASSKLRQHLMKRKNRKLKAITLTVKKRKRQQHFRRRTPPTSITQETPVDTSIVVTLSGVELSNNEVSLLSKGLTFCSVPCRINEVEVLDDLESYFS